MFLKHGKLFFLFKLRLMADAEKLPIQQAEALASDDEEEEDESEDPEDKGSKYFTKNRWAYYFKT